MMHLIGYLLGLTALFAGDFDLFGLPAFLLVYMTIVVFRYFVGLKLLRYELLAMCIGVICSFPVFFKFVLSPAYYYWVFFAAIGSIMLPLLFKWAIEGNPKAILIFNAVLFVCLSVFSLISFQPGERMHLIFGPNILYRIFGVLFVVSIIASSAYSWTIKKQILLYICFLNVALLLLMTGSRGATLVLLLMSFYYYRTQSKYSFIKVLKVLSYSLPIALTAWLLPLFWRSFYFDVQNASEGYRLQFLYSSLDFLNEASIFQLVFGVGPGSKYFINYPHNYLVEILVYHGIYFFLIHLVAALLIMLKKFRLKTEFTLFFFIVSPIVVGSMVSGDLLDNNVVLGLIFYAISIVFKHRSATPVERVEFKWRNDYLSAS